MQCHGLSLGNPLGYYSWQSKRLLTLHTYLLWSEFFFLLSSSKWQFLHKSTTGVLASSPPVLIQDFSKHPMRQGIPWRSHVSSIHSFIHYFHSFRSLALLFFVWTKIFIHAFLYLFKIIFLIKLKKNFPYYYGKKKRKGT